MAVLVVQAVLQHKMVRKFKLRQGQPTAAVLAALATTQPIKALLVKLADRG